MGVGMWSVWFLIIWFLLFGLMITGKVFLALAVYQDARSRYNNNALMWGLLVGFFDLIPAIVYLCLRKNLGSGPILCPSCALYYAPFSGACPRCGAPNPAVHMNAYTDLMAAHKKAKNYLTVAIVAWGLVIVATIVLMLITVFAAIGSAAGSQPYYYR